VNHEERLCLAIVEDSATRAEAHATTLCDAGYPVRFELAKDLATLGALLRSEHPDLVLCGTGRKLPDVRSVTELLDSEQSPVPVIAVIGDTGAATAHAVEEAGAIALVAGDTAGALPEIVKRELRGIQLNRRVRELESRLAETEKRCSALMAGSRDAIAYIRDGLHVHANRSYLDRFGYNNPDDLEGIRVQSLIEASDHGKFTKFLSNLAAVDATPATLEARVLEPSGGGFDAIIECTPARIDGEPCIQMVIRNRADVELGEKLEALGRQDMLTGLCNRQNFMRVVHESIHRGTESGRIQAIAYILLDNFKHIREEIGVAGSDMVVNDIARLIGDTVDREDIVARFGDYVFTVLRQDSNADGVLKLAETLREKIGAHVSVVEGQSAMTTCSIGVAVINAHITGAQEAMSRADMACEVARSSGGNQIHLHSTAVDEKMDGEHEAEWDEVIDATIREERFYLVYQPIVSLNDTPGERYEVLLRVVDEEGHVILPGQFLSIAEKTGKSSEIDHWVIDTAFKALMEQRSKGNETVFFIKLSGATLEDRELPAWISRKLKEYRLKSDSVCFEVPEAVAIRNLKNTMLFFKAMQKLNCRVAIEHFGCANQPQLINHLPVDMLKIDGSLINNLATSKEHQESAKTIIALARKSGIQCAAERVDDAGDLAKLWELGIDFIQGNFVQEPGRELEYNFAGELA